MKTIHQQHLTGERALFQSSGLHITRSTFADGESSLKESSDLLIEGSLFRWKYPLWYCRNVRMSDCTLFSTARAGIWYTRNICMSDCSIDAPKTFRRSQSITLRNVTMFNAAETFWNCRDIDMEDVVTRGDYLAMNSTGIRIDGFDHSGDYSFDGCRDIEIRNARILSKDAFWNCENVVVRDSFISGEYIGWNSRNLTFENCTIESLQGMCFIENLKLVDCRLLNTTLAFEHSTVDVAVEGRIDSVMNPKSGRISADGIGSLILDAEQVDPSATRIEIRTGSGSEAEELSHVS